MGQAGWMGQGATLRVPVRSEAEAAWLRLWGGARALHGKGGGAGPALGPRVQCPDPGSSQQLPQRLPGASLRRMAAAQVGPGDHCHRPLARAGRAGAENSQGVALCPPPSHWLFGGGSNPYPSDAQVWRAPRWPRIAQRRREALPTGHPPPEAGSSEMAAGSILGSGLNMSLKPEPPPLGAACLPAPQRVWSLHSPL